MSVNEDKTAVSSDGAPAAVGPYSQAVKVGDTLYCSGQIALHPESSQLVDEDFAVQARQVLGNLGAVLEAAGMGFRDVVKVTIYLADLDDFAELNEIYAEYFEPPYPARATVEVSGLPKDALVEMDLVAVKSG